MRLEIYVILTELEKARLLTGDIKGLKCLEEQKEYLIRLFGGLTELDFKGYWRDSDRQIETDFGKLWLIYTDKTEKLRDSDVLELETEYIFLERQLIRILRRIREITKQTTQAYAINNKLYLLET